MILQKEEQHTVNEVVRDEPPLFKVENFSLSFRQFQKGLRESNVQVIKKFDLTIDRGEIVAIVGASGSGKSLLADAVLGIVPEHASIGGSIHFEGEVLTKKKQMNLRGKDIFLIPQSVNALDPLMKAGKQVQSVVKGKNKKTIQQRIFEKVGLSPQTSGRYPFQLSGGMARRVLVSAAMISDAKLIIADEPTPGLDVDSRDEIIRYLKQLALEGKGIMFITHDIHAALEIADKIAVFYAGQTIEIADKDDFTGQGERLRHPYTRALWNALPENDFVPLVGSQPLASEAQQGCSFVSSCPLATKVCFEKLPDAREVNRGMVRCFHA